MFYIFVVWECHGKWQMAQFVAIFIFKMKTRCWQEQVKPTHFPDIPVVLAGSLTNTYSGFKNVKSYPKSYFLTTQVWLANTSAAPNTIYHPLSITYCLESLEDINEKTLLKHLLVKEGKGLRKLIFLAAFPTDIRTDCDL